MKSPIFDKVDLSALVDIISNIAGMMILLACVALFIQHNIDSDSEAAQKSNSKPISFPLSYIPEKRSITLCLKYGNLYELPEKELLESIKRQTEEGNPIQWLNLSKNGVDAVIALTPTYTGFRFQYKLNERGGTQLRSSQDIVSILDQMIERFPPNKFFYVFHTWPENFAEFREIREYLLESEVEVGWEPRSHENEPYDIAYSMGEYNENLTTIKAQ